MESQIHARKESQIRRIFRIIAITGTVLASCATIVGLGFAWIQADTRAKTNEELVGVLLLQRNVQETIAAAGNNSASLQATVVALNQRQATIAPSIPTVPISQPTYAPKSANVSCTALPLPFSDNFDTGISPCWTRGSGDWRMANGQLVNTGALGTIWLGKAGWTNMIVEYDTRGYGCSISPLQVLVRMQDLSNYVAIRTVGCGDEGIWLYKSGTPPKRIVQGPCCDAHWKIEVTGPTYRVFKEGQLAESVSDDTFTGGSVGIQMTSGTAVDNFSVRANLP